MYECQIGNMIMSMRRSTSLSMSIRSSMRINTSFRRHEHGAQEHEHRNRSTSMSRSISEFLSKRIQEQVLRNMSMNTDMSNPERRLEYKYQETGKRRLSHG